MMISVSFVAIVGLGAGKWANNLGGFCTVFLFVSMILAALPHWFHGDVAIAPIAWSLPAVSVFNLNLLGKTGSGALTMFAIPGGLPRHRCSESLDVTAKIVGTWPRFKAPVLSTIFGPPDPEPSGGRAGSLERKSEERRDSKKDERHKVVPRQLLFQKRESEDYEDRQRDDLLNDFKLKSGKLAIAEAIGRHRQTVLEQCN